MSEDKSEARLPSLLAFLDVLTDTLAGTTPHAERRGRKPVHDRHFAKSALLDFIANDPDGFVSQGRLVRELEHRFEASGHTLPGETWLKAVVREFLQEAATFERDAAETYHASATLQAVFTSLTDFLLFRRSKARAAQMWREQSVLRSQYASPEKLLEAAFHKGFPDVGREGISANSRLPHHDGEESTVSNERSSA